LNALAQPSEAVGATETVAPPRITPVTPPSSLVAEDSPNDAGGSIIVRWELPQDHSGPAVTGYVVRRAEASGVYAPIDTLSPGTVRFQDNGLRDGRSYTYKVAALGPGGEAESAASSPAIPAAQWFRRDRLNILLIMVLVCGGIFFFIRKATSGGELTIRRIAGMDAVTEAVGRATEMGKPVLYISGIQDMDNVQTLAGLTILGSIAEMIAKYETTLIMPTSRSLVMTTARETVKEAYLAAGRPDAYREDSIYYVTDEQFGFVAHVDGLMLRRKPATCFYLGAFFAESLILAETGNSIGAIQVAGTAQPTQLPFFVAACDYTLIGEELFAASAYLSRDERMLGSLKGQDMGKLLAMAFIGIGCAVATFAELSGAPLFQTVLGYMNWLWTGAAAGGH
jgi:hypothetical protein